MIADDDGIDDWMLLINIGADDKYSELDHTVRCCVKKGCSGGELMLELVCRVRFDMRDKWSIDKAPWWLRVVSGRPFWHIIHFDEVLDETISLP